MSDLLHLSILDLLTPASDGAQADASARALAGAGIAAPGQEAALALRGAALALVVRGAAALIARVPPARLGDALRERRPEAAVAGLLADVALEAQLLGADDPVAAALAAGARRKRDLLAEAGGALSSDAVAAQLGVKRQAVDKRRQTRALLAVPTPSGDWVYPAGQFRADGRALDGLPDVLRAFRVDDPWMQLAELLAPDADLGGRSALDVLRGEGRAGVPALVAAVRGVGEHAA